MLKSQDAVPEPQSVSPVSVSQARVTPDELTQALAAIEARRQAEAAHLAGTIPIDQAVSDLHLDSTSDEIWAEVQAQRIKAAAAQEAARREAAQQKAALQTGTPPLRATLSAPIGLQSDKRGTRPRGWRRLVAPVLVIGVLMSAGVIPHNFTPRGFSPSLLTSKHFPTAAPILTPLSAVPDGKEVYADDAALTQISEGRAITQITVSTNPSGNRWTVFRRSGHVYLRGFIESVSSLAEITGKPLNVYNDDDSGELHKDPTSNITLRVDNVSLQKSGGDSDYSSVTVSNFQPDPLTTLTPGR